MEILVAGLLLFLGSHSISIVSEAWRDRMAARLGALAWRGLYSVVAIIAFALVVWGYGLARQHPVVIYVPPMWLRHVTLLLMLPVFPMLLSTYLPGRIRTTLKHPMLAAVKLWALAHLLATGNLADLVLFGSFLAWASIDRVSMRFRAQRPLPEAPPAKWNDTIALIGGLLLYAFFLLWLHQRLIGVAPLA